MSDGSRVFCGRLFQAEELVTIRELVTDLRYLSFTEISRTICELLKWKRRSGRLRDLECRRMLETLDSERLLHLPEKRTKGFRAVAGSSPCPTDSPEAPLCGSVSEMGDLVIRAVRAGDRRRNARWRDFVDRYHYLGYRLPVGAQIRYFVFAKAFPKRELACLLWSSPAWRVSARDSWIGWNDEQRRRNLQLIVNNGRFLILPWARINGLASKILSGCARRLPADWRKRYGYEPVLLETFVDSNRFLGTCYAAAGWLRVGQTVGRGRGDSEHHKQVSSRKYVFVRPLLPGAKEVLAS
jgi:hypothetical protein